MMRQRLKDRLLFPIVAAISDATAHSLGLTPLDDERLLAALPHCRGRLLDVGCGFNQLVRRYGSGVGVDVFPWDGADAVCDSTTLPFRDRTFDTVTFLACLNHIVHREQVLADVHRVLREDGRLIVTMINPIVGAGVHRLRHAYDHDQLVRGLADEEKYGMWNSEVRSLLAATGFRVVKHIPFVFRLNNLFIATKPGATPMRSALAAGGTPR